MRRGRRVGLALLTEAVRVRSDGSRRRLGAALPRRLRTRRLRAGGRRRRGRGRGRSGGGRHQRLLLRPESHFRTATDGRSFVVQMGYYCRRCRIGKVPPPYFFTLAFSRRMPTALARSLGPFSRERIAFHTQKLNFILVCTIPNLLLLRPSGSKRIRSIQNELSLPLPKLFLLRRSCRLLLGPFKQEGFALERVRLFVFPCFACMSLE